MGCGVVVDEPGRLYVSGAACQPWKADVVFIPLSPDEFTDYDEPDHVKIVWSLEVAPTGPSQTRLSTEIRVVATDDQARRAPDSPQVAT